MGNSHYFIFQHLIGTHEFNTDANGNYKEKTSVEETARGCMTIMEGYITSLGSLVMLEIRFLKIPHPLDEVSTFVSVVYTVAMISLVATAPKEAYERAKVSDRLGGKDQYTVSADKNIIVFVLVYFLRQKRQESRKQKKRPYKDQCHIPCKLSKNP